MKRIFGLFLLLICLAAAAFAEASSAGEARADKRPVMRGRHGGWGMSSGIFVIMKKLKAENPAEYERLNELRKRDFKAFMKEIRALMPKHTNFKRIGELKKQEIQLAKKIVEVKDEKEKSALEEELRQKLKEDFDIMVKEAEARIEMMRQYLITIKENEQQFLQERYDLMLNNAKNRAEKNNLPPPPSVKK